MVLLPLPLTLTLPSSPLPPPSSPSASIVEAQSPPNFLPRSNTVTLCPARDSSRAAASPEGVTAGGSLAVLRGSALLVAAVGWDVVDHQIIISANSDTIVKFEYRQLRGEQQLKIRQNNLTAQTFGASTFFTKEEILKLFGNP